MYVSGETVITVVLIMELIFIKNYFSTQDFMGKVFIYWET
jgi:hypothetical protein